MEIFPQIPSGNFQLDVGEDSASNVATELDSETTAEAETIPGEVPFRFSPDIEMLISDNEVVENEVVDNEVVEVVDLISVTSSEVEYVGQEFVHEDLTPEQELDRMRSEERWGHLDRIQDQQSAAHIRISQVCQDVQSLSYQARRLRHIAVSLSIHGSSAFLSSSASAASARSADPQPHQSRQPSPEPHSGTF